MFVDVVVGEEKKFIKIDIDDGIFDFFFCGFVLFLGKGGCFFEYICMGSYCGSFGKLYLWLVSIICGLVWVV